MRDAGMGSGVSALDLSAAVRTAGRSGKKDAGDAAEGFGEALGRAADERRLDLRGKADADISAEAGQDEAGVAPHDSHETAKDAPRPVQPRPKGKPATDLRAAITRTDMPARAETGLPAPEQDVGIATEAAVKGSGKAAIPADVDTKPAVRLESALPADADAETDESVGTQARERPGKGVEKSSKDYRSHVRHGEARAGKEHDVAVEAAEGERDASVAADALTLLHGDEAVFSQPDTAPATAAQEKPALPPSDVPVAPPAAMKPAMPETAQMQPGTGGPQAVAGADGRHRTETAETGRKENEAASTEGRIFRFSRADGKGQSLNMVIGGREASERTPRDARSPHVETVTVLDARRYLALSPNANTVAAALSGDPEWVGAMQPGSALSNAASQASTGKVVNTLKIQIHPMTLGAVTATMRLAGDELTVDLQVETAAAYRQLSDDQRGLVESLRAQGFSVDQVTVTLVSAPDKPDASGAQANNGQNAAFGQQSPQDGGASSRRDDRHATQQNERANPSRAEDAQGGVSAASGGRPDHLYL